MPFERIEPRELKRRLTEHFRHPFKAHRSRGTASHWINVNWTDGPTDKEVSGFLLTFDDSGRDDIMTDLWCGSQYTSTSRHHSPDAFWWAVGEVERKFGVKLTVTDEISKYTGARSLYIKREDDLELEGIDRYPDRYASSQVNHRLYETDFRKINLPPAPPLYGATDPLERAEARIMATVTPDQD
jgi:hypothetical protein